MVDVFEETSMRTSSKGALKTSASASPSFAISSSSIPHVCVLRHGHGAKDPHLSQTQSVESALVW